MKQVSCKTHRYRRYKQYDYQRGAALFITITTKPRQAIFSHVEGRRVVLSDFGKIVAHELQITKEVVPELSLERWVIMPDHLHLLLWLHPGLEAPLRALGRFVGGFKRAVRQRWKEAGHAEPLWESGFHDRICLSETCINAVRLYIDYNPLKWTLMKSTQAALKTHEPLDSPRLSPEDYWKGVGNLELLTPQRRLCAVRISRRIPEAEFPTILKRMQKGAAEGWILVSTFLSPGERAVYQMLIQDGRAFIQVKPSVLPPVYRPTVQETPLFATNRLLLLSQAVEAEELTRQQCQDLNTKILDMTNASVYVMPQGLVPQADILPLKNIRQNTERIDGVAFHWTQHTTIE